jgi:hypothetical protein
MPRFWIAIVLTLCTAPASAACRVTPRATVPVARAGTLLLVPVTINGTTLNFLLDTGAERSVISLAAADQVHLVRDEWVSTDMQGAGGRDRRRLGLPATLTLGGMPLVRRTMAADHSIVVGPIAGTVAGQPIAGLLGQDFLSPFDLDLDPATSKLTLYNVADCTGRFLPWPGPYQAIAAGRPVRNILTLPLRIGGTTLQAELDSGASASVITLPGMLQLGLTAGGADTASGFGPGSLAAHMQPFPAVQVGTLPSAPAAFAVAPIRTLRSIGALLGADWLAGRHVWISWGTNQIFVSG